jgi:hypothetical protein
MSGARLTFIAAAVVALAASSPAQAGIIQFDNGWTFDYGLTATYTPAARVKEPASTTAMK